MIRFKCEYTNLQNDGNVRCLSGRYSCVNFNLRKEVFLLAKMNKLITITTDFGDQLAAAQLKAVLADLGFDGQVIENHSVTAFSIIEGSFALALLAKFCPKGTTHVGVVDPGVGSNRRGIIIKTDKSWFVGPDNGLLFQAATSEKIRSVWKINESSISKDISPTFHGRDVFIKSAAYLSLGKQPEDFGSTKIPAKSLAKLYFKRGQVLHIDPYGNIKLHCLQKIYSCKKLTIKTRKNTFIVPFVKTFSDVPKGKPLAFLGSSQTLELAVNLKRADTFFRVKQGDILKIML